MTASGQVSPLREYVGLAVLGLLGVLMFGWLSALNFWLGFGPPSNDPAMRYVWAAVYGLAALASLALPVIRIVRRVKARSAASLSSSDRT